jgi:soluble lytic murein transglycosylase-like protein
VDSLTQPGFNIRYGVYYLRELLDQFNENLVLVLAGYNGGPHNARKWYERNKHEEFDLFVEDLLYSETRNYVKKVLGNYWTYQYLARNPGLRHIYYAESEILNVSAGDSVNVKRP